MDTQSTTSTIELVSEREAATLLEVIRMLRAITERAGRAAYDLPVFEPGGAVSSDAGRLAGVASLANDVVFNVLNVAATWAEQPAARDAINRLNEKEA